jgi:hypothetical protein
VSPSADTRVGSSPLPRLLEQPQPLLPLVVQFPALLLCPPERPDGPGEFVPIDPDFLGPCQGVLLRLGPGDLFSDDLRLEGPDGILKTLQLRLGTVQGRVVAFGLTDCKVSGRAVLVGVSSATDGFSARRMSGGIKLASFSFGFAIVLQPLLQYVSHPSHTRAIERVEKNPVKDVLTARES